MYAAVGDTLDPDFEYEEKPHIMGRPASPRYRRRVARGPVSFAPSIEFSCERLDDSGLWDTVISDLVEKVNSGCIRYSGKKTKTAIVY